MQAQKGQLPRLIDSHLDYLSASLPAGDPDYRELMLWANNVLVIERAKGFELRPYSGHGYTGQQTRHFGVAQSQNGLLLRCSGPTSREHAADAVCISSGLRASRIDLQTTTRAFGSGMQRQRRLYEKICKLQEQGHRVGKLDKRIYESPDGGATVTLGNPNSARQFRYYNKSIEMGPGAPPNLERYELQCRDKLAKKLLAGWSASSDRHLYAAKQVRGYMSRYGIEEEWEWAPDAEWVPRGRPDSDLDVCLNWLDKQVSPSIQRVIEGERLKDLADALKISPENLEQMAALIRGETTKLKNE